MAPSDTIELLANLNFVVEKLWEKSGRPSRNEVLQMLAPRLRKRQTDRQIQSKLESLSGSTDPKTIEDVYRYGSSRIRNLDSDLKLKVQEELNIIKSEEVCNIVITPRKLRSVSQNPASEASHAKQNSFNIGERTSTRSASRNLAAETSRSKRESTTFGERTPTRTIRRPQRGEAQNRVSKFARNKPFSRKQTPSNRITITAPSQTSSPQQPKTPPRTRIADTEERIKSSRSPDTCGEEVLDYAPTLRSALQSFFYATDLQDIPIIDYDDINTIHHFPEKLVLDRSHETLRDLFNDNIYFRKKWSDEEERRKKIEQNDRFRHSLLGSGSADVLQTMARTIETQNETIDALKRQLSNQQFLKPFLTLGKGEEVPLNQAKIQIHHGRMRRDFRSLSIMNCFQHPGETSTFFKSQDLNELESRVSSDVYRHPIGLVVQSLTGAAICEWVFNGELQCTAMMNTPLLDAYRYQLDTICGELALRNIDLAAHQWVINKEKCFEEEFLPRTATKLSERLFNAFGPFMKNKGNSEGKLQLRLKSIFCAALNIKTCGMIGKNMFEFTWPAQNSIFERNSMVEESSEGSTYNPTSSKQEAKKVMLALVPGLRVYSYDRKLVDYCGFKKGDEEGLGQSSLVAQAVVVAL